MSAMSLVFWAWLRDRIYPLYSAFILTGLTLMLLRETFQDSNFAQNTSATQFIAVSQCLFNATSTAFFSSIFEFRKNFAWAFFLFRIAVGLNIVALLASLLGMHEEAIPLANLVVLTTTISGFIFICRCLFTKESEHLMTAAAFLVPGIFAIVTLLERIELLQINFRLDAGSPSWLAVRFFSLLALAMAVARRTRIAEVEVHYERGRALKAALEMESILEGRVSQRTKELARSNQLLVKEINHRKESQLHLKQALDAKDAALATQKMFIEMVSHEFRTPLAIIDAVAHSLDRPNSSREDEYLPRVAKIKRAVVRLSTLLSNVLAEDRINPLLPASLSFEEIDFNLILRQSLEDINPHDKHRIRTKKPGINITIWADRSLIFIVVSNIVQNALKYSKENDPVEIEISLTKDNALLQVRDFGPGIKENEQTLIFEKFYRATNASRIPGTGLGLYLSREIARQHCGDVTLTHSSVQGSLFQITIPLAYTALGFPTTPGVATQLAARRPKN